MDGNTYNMHSRDLSLTLPDKMSLYASYMPFLKQGGLFVPTEENFKLGDEISLTIHLMNDPNTLFVPGLVVWITPKAAQGNRVAGVGVQLNNDTELMRILEAHLAGILDLEHPTHTM